MEEIYDRKTGRTVKGDYGTAGTGRTGFIYTEYLKTMSQFHNYSFNNTLLIAMQKTE